MTKPSRSLNLAFYSTPPYACSYLPHKQAVTLFADPSIPKTPEIYAVLSSYGFRRSGEHLYRPRCPRCSACVPARVPVRDFRPNRAQRRTMRLNADLEIRTVAAQYRNQHFDLYCRYLQGRHPGGGMDNPTPESFMDFLTATWSDSEFMEFRYAGRLVAVAVVDTMKDALSAVYTYYDPLLAKRSLGRFAILKQIETAAERGLRWLYLGYWIKECRKMAYKNEYQPLEYYFEGYWTRQCALA